MIRYWESIDYILQAQQAAQDLTVSRVATYVFSSTWTPYDTSIIWIGLMMALYALLLASREHLDIKHQIQFKVLVTLEAIIGSDQTNV